MFVVENTIKVKKGYAEHMQGRFHQLGEIEKVPGFIELNLLRKKGDDDCDVIVVWSKWESQQAHNDWHASDMFRQSHSGARSEALIESKIALYDVIANRVGEAVEAKKDAI